MASNITLSAGVRQNLLSLQNTAQLMSQTQNRLATGQKVNSALDNPGNFFTSRSLATRASDLNALLDSVGQAQQTLKAADDGLSSLTKLVESAKSIAQQARQAPQAASTVYSAFTVTGDPTNETLATHDGAAVTVADSTAYSF
ncbi:MAG: flagellar protein, partial [Xanthobacteraceae bacterium]